MLSLVHKKLFFQFRKFSDLFVFIQSKNLTLTYLGAKWFPDIFVLQVLVTQVLDLMKFGDIRANLSGTNILQVFLKI